MLRIEKLDDKSIQLKVNYKYPVTNFYSTCKIDFSSNFERELAFHNLSNSFEDYVVDIKRKAYNDGWRDAKAKVKKQQEF